MVHSQMDEKNKTMILLVMVDEEEVHLEVVELDLGEKIFQIYLIHFLVDDFLEGGKELKGKQREEEKTLNMICV